MIATTTEFWIAFFDPEDPKHEKARSDIRIFDKEKIVVSQFVAAEVVLWLDSRNKHKRWFLDYIQNTANTRLFHYGREEFRKVAEMSDESHLTITEASVEYLRKELNCDVTDY